MIAETGADLRLHPSVAVSLAVLLLACAHPGALPTPPAGVHTVAVAPPVDHTGTVVGGERFLERLLGQPRTTLGDVLAAEMRGALARRGIAVAAETGTDVATFAVEVRRWEPDTPALRFVLVSLDARLVRDDGRTLWSARRDDWQVPTRGAPTPEAGATMAAHAVAEALVAGWRP
jgi:hypothetical protein